MKKVFFTYLSLSHLMMPKNPRLDDPLSNHPAFGFDNFGYAPLTKGDLAPHKVDWSLYAPDLADQGNVAGSSDSLILEKHIKKTGFEEAFAFGCLNDPSTFAHAHQLLLKADHILGKVLDLPDLSEYTYEIPIDIIKQRYQFYCQKIGDGEHCNLAERFYKIINTHESCQGVELREKMDLLYMFLGQLPELIQEKSGVGVFKNYDDFLKITEDKEAIKERTQKIKKHLRKKGLHQLINSRDAATFSAWGLKSKATQDFHDPSHSTKSRIPHPSHKGREERTFLMPESCKGNQEPSYKKVKTFASRGVDRFLLNPTKDWYQENEGNQFFIPMTGPSGTFDVFLRMHNLLKLSMNDKTTAIKTMIAYMHLDRHHSIYEILSVLDADPELLEHLGFDSIDDVLENPMAALEKIDPDLFAKAIENQPNFMQAELDLRAQLDKYAAEGLRVVKL